MTARIDMSRLTASARKLAVLCLLWASIAAAAQDYEGYYLCLGGYPQQETEWSENVQGVAHDDNNWFIANTQILWKIPVQVDLRTADVGQPGVLQTSFGNIQELAGYDHFGDPDVYRYHDNDTGQDTDYLLVPIEDPDATCTSGLPGAIAILRTNLTYVHHVVLPGQCNDAGWVAVRRSDGHLFASRQHIGQPGPPENPPDPDRQGGLREYTLNWDLVPTRQAVATFVQEHPLSNEFNCMQGGEFAPGDNLLYLVSGFHDDSNELADREGIHVLETASWTRVAHSTRGFGHFDYYYNPGFPINEEPEGLTIWDLDDGRAPGIGGQLHVFVLDNDDPPQCPFCDQDDIDFKHYTNIIRVNPASSCESGTPACPFRTVGAAANLAWDAAEIRIRANTYAETLTISKRVRLTAENGTARIGG